MSIVTTRSTSFVVEHDFATMRNLFERIRRSKVLAPLNLFRRRNYRNMLDYLDRRADQRCLGQLRLSILPAEFDGTFATASNDETILGATRELSLRGMGFLHDDSFSAMYAVVKFDSLDVEPIRTLLEVRWSHFETSEERYVSGGRFLGLARPTLARNPRAQAG